MSNWEKVRLGDVCNYESSRASTSTLNLGTYISTENMLPNRGGVTLASSLPTSGNVTKFRKGKVLVSNIRPYFKKIWRATFDGCCSNDVLCFDLKDGVDELYFYYLLSQDAFFDYVLAGSKGTKMPRGDKKQIMNFEFALPNLDEQKRIANILGALDDKIELNNRINKNLEEQASALFKRWFVDFEFPNSNNKPYLLSGGELKQSPLGNIPSDWNVGTLGDIIELFDSKRIPLSKDQRDKMEKIYPYYGAASLMDYVDDYIFDGEYLLLGEDGTVTTDEGLPILQYVWGKFWVNNHAHIMKGKNGYTVSMLYLALKNTNIKHLVTGAVQPKINQANLKSLQIILPNTELLRSLNDIIDNVFKQYQNIYHQNQTLTKLRDTLLPKLMNNEMRL